MDKPGIFGLSAALVTPFHPGGTVDPERLARHAKHVLAEGCDSITLFGTTGEGYGITLKERAAMLEAAAGDIDFETSLYAGVMAAGMDDAAEQARLALDAGARGLLFAPPFYLKGVDDEGLYAWFARTFEKIGASTRGVILYHIPGQTAVPLSVELVGRLRNAFPGVIIGIKDSSGKWEDAQRFLSAHGDLAVLIGDERLLARSARAGGQGSICGVANLTPRLLRSMIYHGEDNATVTRLVDMIVRNPVLATIKALVGHIHRDQGFGVMRPPVSPLDPGQKDEVTAAFDAILAER